MDILTVKVSSDPKLGQVLTCSGNIMEGAGSCFTAAVDSQKMRLCFDLSGVELMNSCGVVECMQNVLGGSMK